MPVINNGILFTSDSIKLDKGNQVNHTCPCGAKVSFSELYITEDDYVECKGIGCGRTFTTVDVNMILVHGEGPVRT
jgi:hypothetical protein